VVSMAAPRCAELLYFQCIELSGSIWQVCNRMGCVCPDSGLVVQTDLGLAVRTDAPAARVVGSLDRLIADACWGAHPSR
jgi:hypothetical protein